jgi:hypothetical protein
VDISGNLCYYLERKQGAQSILAEIPREVPMKRPLILMLLFLCLGVAVAEPARFTFVPGRMGPVQLGQPVESTLSALKDWTYSVDAEYAIGAYYIFPREAPGVMVEFILGFDRKKKLRDIEIHDPRCAMEGHPEIHLGCTRRQMEAALGTRQDFTDYYCDYNDLGIRFIFDDGRPPRQQDPYQVPRFAKGQCKSIQIYRPDST